MSTTTERGVAMGYAAGGGPKMGIVLEMQQGMVDRGADISWLSQAHKLATSYKLQATSYRLQATSYKLQATSYKPQAT